MKHGAINIEALPDGRFLVQRIVCGVVTEHYKTKDLSAEPREHAEWQKEVTRLMHQPSAEVVLDPPAKPQQIDMNVWERERSLTRCCKSLEEGATTLHQENIRLDAEVARLQLELDVEKAYLPLKEKLA